MELYSSSPDLVTPERRKLIALAIVKLPLHPKRPQLVDLRLRTISLVEQLQARGKEGRRKDIYDNQRVFSGPRRRILRQVKELLR